jgi:hypothetical protein
MPSNLKMNTCDLKSKIKKESLATWQNQWEQIIKVFNRGAQVVITRMRIGHTHLTHSYHMNPLCVRTVTRLWQYLTSYMTVGCLVLRERNMESPPWEKTWRKNKFTVFLEKKLESSTCEVFFLKDSDDLQGLLGLNKTIFIYLSAASSVSYSALTWPGILNIIQWNVTKRQVA